MTPSSSIKTGSLLDLAKVFLKLGTIAFGGPAAHIAMMEQEFVRKRQWLSHQEFLDMLGAANLLPGPTSTEMAIFIGYRQAGWMGLALGGCCFILPAMLMTGTVAWAYVRYGTLPQAGGILFGVKPVVIAIIAQALWGLGRVAVKTRTIALVGLVAIVAAVAGVNPLLILFGTGVLMVAGRWLICERKQSVAELLLLLGKTPKVFGVASVSATAALPVGLWPLFLAFVKIGGVVFGSGYVLLAFLRTDLVERWHWLTSGQLLDAVAVGQVTPGPVFTTATFIGYVLAGAPGAVVATIGIFLPSFLLVAISGPLVPRLRQSPMAGAFLDGVVIASLGLMAVVTSQLLRAAVVDSITVLLAAVSAFLLFRYKTNSAWLVLGGAMIGMIARH
jgi:chromate transporter